MTREQLAGMIDHTILTPEASSAEVHRVVTEGMQNGFASVCVGPVWVSRAVTMAGGEVMISTVAGFPHGTSKATLKAIECTAALKDGAAEVDVVAHLPNLLRADVDAIRAELLEIVKAARATRRTAVVKVIIESALLQQLGNDRGEAAIAAACRAIRESGCDFVKTSTGFHPAGGASAEAVRMIKKYAEGLQIKAAGGIRDLATARAMIEAGADRLGCGASMQLLEQLAAEGT
ncbi:MAG TPA: deoxyribose-phosphate aldolase [Tepidisphaeraceae bacterium]|jgi:deoxyribose-phosphate aldolase